MAFKLPPPPQSNDLKGSAWQDWFFKLQAAFTAFGSIIWGAIDFTGSNLTDLVIRNHNDLQNLQGGAPGDYQHLTTAQVALIGASGALSNNVISVDFTVPVDKSYVVVSYLTVNATLIVNGNLGIL